jgi:hypothetical protein
MPPKTTVTSFVLRFVQETTEVKNTPPRANWHGVIKHVQTNEEQRFTRLADAIAFVARHVDVDESLVNGGEGHISHSTARPRADDITSNTDV